jgi:L-lactate dehydrogenase (cytochrome)
MQALCLSANRGLQVHPQRHFPAEVSMWRRGPTQLEDCYNIADLRSLARRRLPSAIFNSLDGGAEDESTVRRNTAVFEEQRLIPRCLIDVTAVSTAIHLFGQSIEWPVFCSPTGASRFYHPEGELAVARAAARSGTFYSLSTLSTHSLEDVATATCGPKLFQLYIFKDRGLTRELIERCKGAGYSALCLTVDAAVRGKRERELRNGLGVPLKLSFSGLASVASCPTWFLRQARRGPLSMPNIAARASSRGLLEETRYIGEQLDASVSWKDVREMAELWGGPFALKGVMSVDDAQRAIDVGATAVIISNHGGRQLDGAAATLDVLPEIARAVGDRVEVILDGGIRRGVHVLKALARGAKACSVGRPYLFGLGASGEQGVSKALDILRAELVNAMKLCGCTDVTRIDGSLVRRC